MPVLTGSASRDASEGSTDVAGLSLDTEMDLSGCSPHREDRRLPPFDVPPWRQAPRRCAKLASTLMNVRRNSRLRAFLAIAAILILRPHPLPARLVDTLDKARQSYRSGDSEQGIRSIEDAVAYAPYLLALYRPAAEGALANGDPASALRLALAASEAFPDSQAIRCLIIYSRIALDGRDLALGLDLEQVASCPQGAITLADASQSLFDRGEANRAGEILAFLLGLPTAIPRDAALLAALFTPEEAEAALREIALRDQEERALAQDLLAVLEETTGEEAATRTAKVGHVFSRHGEWEFAALSFREATRLQPENAQAHAYLGLALDQLGSDGLDEIVRAGELNPTDPMPAIFLGLHWLHAGDAGRARQELERALRLDPSSLPLLAELSRVQALLGDVRGAKENLLEATRIDPSDPRYWIMLAQFSTDYEVEVRELGLPAARNALVLSRSCAQCLDLIGYGYYLTGNLPLAERFLWEASGEDPHNAKTLYHLGILLAFQGRTDLARQALNSALALDADGAVTPLVIRTLDRLGP